MPPWGASSRCYRASLLARFRRASRTRYERAMSAPCTIRRVRGVDDATLHGLTDVLVDCVESGASVSFLKPFTRERALAFWRRVADGVERDERALLVAEDAEGVCGTDAARLYERLGWVRVGGVPRFALDPDGAFCGTTYFYRDLGRGA